MPSMVSDECFLFINSFKAHLTHLMQPSEVGTHNCIDEKAEVSNLPKITQ